MKGDADSIVFLVMAELKSNEASIEGCFIDDRSAAEELTRERGGWVAPLDPGIYPEGNAGPIPGRYWPDVISGTAEADAEE